jgi:hypothetical protein
MGWDDDTCDEADRQLMCDVHKKHILKKIKKNGGYLPYDKKLKV